MAVLEVAAEMEGASVTQSALCGVRGPLQRENVTAAWNEVGLNGDSKIRVETFTALSDTSIWKKIGAQSDFFTLTLCQ